MGVSARRGVLRTDHRRELDVTGEQLYQRMQASLAEYLAACPPKERHRWTGRLIYEFCARVRELATPEQWREFNDALYAHGYHRHGQ